MFDTLDFTTELFATDAAPLEPLPLPRPLPSPAGAMLDPPTLCLPALGSCALCLPMTGLWSCTGICSVTNYY